MKTRLGLAGSVRKPFLPWAQSDFDQSLVFTIDSTNCFRVVTRQTIAEELEKIYRLEADFLTSPAGAGVTNRVNRTASGVYTILMANDGPLIEELNRRENMALRWELAQNPSSRIVTAIAVVNDHRYGRTNAISGQIDVPFNSIINGIDAESSRRIGVSHNLSDETVVAYQLSYPCWKPGEEPVIGGLLLDFDNAIDPSCNYPNNKSEQVFNEFRRLASISSVEERVKVADEEAGRLAKARLAKLENEALEKEKLEKLRIETATTFVMSAKTANYSGAGTDAAIHLRFNFRDGSSHQVRCPNQLKPGGGKYDDNKQGKLTVYRHPRIISDREVRLDQLASITLVNDCEGGNNDGWIVDWVRVEAIGTSKKRDVLIAQENFGAVQLGCTSSYPREKTIKLVGP